MLTLAPGARGGHSLAGVRLAPFMLPLVYPEVALTCKALFTLIAGVRLDTAWYNVNQSRAEASRRGVVYHGPMDQGHRYHRYIFFSKKGEVR